MKFVFQKHQDYERYIKSIKLEQPAVALDQEETHKIIEAKPEILKVYEYAGSLAKRLQESMPDQEMQKASFLFKGHYYNTIINMAKHWGVYSKEDNIRLVLDNGAVHVELRHLYGNTIEIWNIMMAKELRGTGHGTAIMEILQKLAVEMDIELALVPCAQCDDGSYDDWARLTIKLRQWYEKLGFEADNKSGYMYY